MASRMSGIAHDRTEVAQPAAPSPVLLYDGLCGFCNTSVQFILGHETRHTLRFAALQGTFAGDLKRRHPKLDDVDSLVWVEGAEPDERVWIRSDAVLRAVSYMGGFWKLFLVFRVIPRAVRDFFYDVFARNRIRFFGRYGSCPVPTREVRSRFLG